MAKVEVVDGQAQAITSMLAGLGLKRKQELVERNDRLRMQFLSTQKMAATKAREGQLNTFLTNVVAGDRKMRELVFSAWSKDNSTTLGEVPEFADLFKRDDEGEPTEDEIETAAKDAIAAFKKWIKTGDFDAINVYARMGPHDFPAKVLTTVKSPKPKGSTGALAEGDLPGGAPAEVVGGVPESVVAELRADLASQKEQYEAKLSRADDEVTKFKRLLEENKEKRKGEVGEIQDKARAELTTKTTEWQRVEANLRKEIADLGKAKLDQTDKTSRVRDELVPLKQQLEKAEREAKRAQLHSQEAREAAEKHEEENLVLRDRVKALESLQQQLVVKEKQLQRLESRGASVMITKSDNLKIWEECLNEKEVKDALTRTLNLDTIAVTRYEHDERDLHDLWKKLLGREQDIVDRFFAMPMDELQTPSDEFRELITNFIELKDTLVAREQLAHLINFVGNRFLTNLKQKV